MDLYIVLYIPPAGSRLKFSVKSSCPVISLQEFAMPLYTRDPWDAGWTWIGCDLLQGLRQHIYVSMRGASLDECHEFFHKVGVFGRDESLLWDGDDVWVLMPEGGIKACTVDYWHGLSWLTNDDAIPVAQMDTKDEDDFPATYMIKRGGFADRNMGKFQKMWRAWRAAQRENRRNKRSDFPATYMIKRGGFADRCRARRADRRENRRNKRKSKD